MKIKEYKIISNEKDGSFPKLYLITEHNVLYDDIYLYHHYNNYEFEYMFFGDTLKLQNNYVEYFYVMSYDEMDKPIGIIQISSGGRTETAIPFDTMFTYLLLTGSKSFITIHNHPNNYSNKSNEDKLSESSIETLSKLLNIVYKQGLIITKEIIMELHQDINDFNKSFLGEEDFIPYEDFISYNQ